MSRKEQTFWRCAKLGGLVRESEERSEALGVDGRGGGLGWFELEGGGEPLFRVGAVDKELGGWWKEERRWDR